MSEQMTEALITVMARWKRGQKMREWGGGKDRRQLEVVREENSGAQAPILASECQLWQQTERRDNCFVKGVIAITSLILREQSTF